MEQVTTIAELRSSIARWRAAGERIALVPTMGNLHRGHLNLVERALAEADRVVVSIFVNPMQFGPNEDLDNYPRTPEDDAEALRKLGVALLFTPEVAEVYPQGDAETTFVEVPGISELLCGASRPGHFRGVATVVAKLFNMVQPDLAVFGEKDYQQLTIIRRMVADLCFPIDIIGVETAREPSGLALSSRNNYLSEEQRERAAELYATLKGIAERLRGGESDLAALESDGRQRLEQAGFRPDYLTIRRQGDLSEPGATDRALVVLAAAFMGKTRLIDNLSINK